MKSLITADWHVGINGDSELFQNIFVEWVKNFLIPTIQAENVKEVFILGDFFNNRNNVNVKSENIALDSIKEITEYSNVTIILGNHDIYFKNTRDINSLKKFTELNKVDIIDRPSITNIDNRIIYLVPWLLENEIDYVMKVKGDICLGHFPFNGFELTRGMTELNGYSFEELKNNFKLVLSGHFHLRNDVYVGSPFHMNWSDEGDIKGVTILDTETLNCKFIPNTISPIYKKIYLSQLKNKTVSIDVVKNNFIKVFLDESYTDKMLEKLQEVILSKKPLSFTFEGLTEEINKDVEVKDITNPIDSLINWVDKIEMRKGIDKIILMEKMNSLYKNSL